MYRTESQIMMHMMVTQSNQSEYKCQNAFAFQTGLQPLSGTLAAPKRNQILKLALQLVEKLACDVDWNNEAQKIQNWNPTSVVGPAPNVLRHRKNFSRAKEKNAKTSTQCVLSNGCQVNDIITADWKLIIVICFVRTKRRRRFDTTAIQLSPVRNSSPLARWTWLWDWPWLVLIWCCCHDSICGRAEVWWARWFRF